MIISASRRTDIPAFYSDWFLNRLREGYVLVPNPRNPRRYSRISLNTDVVDCIVFWTKNPAPMIRHLDEISKMGYPFYFQFTLTPYDKEIERGLPAKGKIIETFQKLSEIISPKRVIWRYDPVILSDTLDMDYHVGCFEKMASLLSGYTNRCIFVKHASCIDKNIIEEIIGCPIHARKDIHQRPACGCVESIDIGAYDCCPHGCAYCYATSSPQTAVRNVQAHRPESPALISMPEETSVISEREMKSLKDVQLTFFH